MDINELKARAKNLDPVLRIGKNGLTENTILEIEKLLKKRKLIKIKVLNNAPVEDVGELIEIARRRTSSAVVSVIGNVFSLYKER